MLFAKFEFEKEKFTFLCFCLSFFSEFKILFQKKKKNQKMFAARSK